jgi:6,7-dimethyl-8-ribityllumazine synthase
MLKQVTRREQRAGSARFAVVAAEFNPVYVEGMLAAAREVFARAGVRALEVVRVPGAFEIPVVAAALARRRRPRYSAILCLGVILRGETTHAQHIGEAVTLSLAQLQLQALTPVIHGVYLFENDRQAKVRCLDPRHNRGTELAQTALRMAAVMPACLR